jgi:hypothetical protein
MDLNQEDCRISHIIGNLLLWVIFLVYPYYISLFLNSKMNTRGKVQLISGMILDYFIESKAPSWAEMSGEFIKYNITKLTGMEHLSEEFLKTLFKNNQDIVEKIEFFKDHHYLLIILLLKEEYLLDACFECGNLLRKTSIGMEESNHRSCNNWMIDY